MTTSAPTPHRHPTAKKPGRFLKIILPILILVFALLAARIIYSNPPEAPQHSGPKRSILSVETMVLKPEPYQAEIVTYGTVQAQSQGELISQVSGVVTRLGANVHPGAFFQKNELLFQLDDRDYRAALKIAEAALATAQAKLIEEQARSLQAEKDWQRMGNDRAASDLVLRKPYLKSAQASALEAEARLEKSQLDLERTSIRAPYTGRVLTKHVDIGQFVGAGLPLIEIYASDSLEVRLPLNSRQQELVNQDSTSATTLNSANPIRVTIEPVRKSPASLIRHGQISRFEARIDSSTQQLYAVASIDDSRNQPLALGEFVKATIFGRQFEQVFVIPAHALYSNDQVLLLTDNRVERRQVTVIQRGMDRSIIDGNLSSGAQLITTPLGNITSGTQATQAEDSGKP